MIIVIVLVNEAITHLFQRVNRLLGQSKSTETEVSVEVCTSEIENDMSVVNVTSETELAVNESPSETEMSLNDSTLTPETKLSVDVSKSKIDRRRNDEETYAIYCGTAVIFNNIHYNKNARSGTVEDEDNLKETLEGLGLEVTVHRDVDTTTLLRELQKVAKVDHSQMDCFVCAILSHGGQSELTVQAEQRVCDVIRCRNGIIAAKTLMNCLSDDEAPTLVNKPKLFFIQACRGTAMSATVERYGDGRPPKTVEPSTWDEIERNLTYDLPADLPVYPDVLLAWSTVPGYFSFRGASGSPFIKHLCDGLRDYREYDLLTILTLVQSQVATKYSSFAPSTVNNPHKINIHNKKQMPWVASMLTRKVYFAKVMI